jgi:pimeloyl-ACP methyl ester carboxylesterase
LTALQLDQVFEHEGEIVRFGLAGDGPPLVLVHGTPFSSFVWRRIAPLLARRRTIFWYDLLGYGQSDKRDGQDVSLGRQDRLLVALFGYWGIERPDVVAHDFGGATALRALVLDGLGYRSLTLIDPVALSPWGSPLVQHVRRYEDAFAGLPAYVHQAIVEAYIKGAACKPLPLDVLAAYVGPWLGEIGQPAFYRQIAQMNQRYTDEIASGLATIATRTQILWGENDEWISIDRGRRLASIIPGASFRAVPEAGHLVQEDAPEVVVASLVEFL